MAFPRLSRRCAAGLLAAGLILPVRLGHGLDLTPHSFSYSKQFVVYAQDGAIRNAVGTLGDDAKNGVLGLLGARDKWKIPIVIDLRPPEPGLPDARPPVRLQFSQTASGMKIELDLLTGEAGRGTRIQDELVRTVLLALAYQNATAGLTPGRAYTLPPPWLVEGISAYLDNQENGVSASMFAALLPTLQTMGNMDFLKKDPAGMDSTSQAVYRACAYNLVCLFLRDLPGGRGELAAFVNDLPNTTQGVANSGESLGKYFPELAASPDALAKWWALALAQLAAGDRFHMYTAEETERRLQALLTFPGPVAPKSAAPPKTCTLADFREFTPMKENARILEDLRAGLVLLSGQASPIYHPIVTGYQEVVAALIRNRTGGVGQRLRELEARRRDALRQRDGIMDYVNWYEATQVPTQSGAFNEYFHASHQLDASQKIHRPDPISAYLDSLDTEFQSR